jgi:Uma2 family endonuclease
VTPAPSPKHQEIAGELYALLSAYVKANKLGKVYIAPVDILLEEHTVVQPDILFIRQERLSIIGEKKVDAAPDLVVEVLSPSTFYKDLRKKMAAYSQFGVQEYWIVDPEKQSIEVHTQGSKGLQLALSLSLEETLESALLPGFQLRVKSIF